MSDLEVLFMLLSGVGIILGVIIWMMLGSFLARDAFSEAPEWGKQIGIDLSLNICRVVVALGAFVFTPLILLVMLAIWLFSRDI